MNVYCITFPNNKRYVGVETTTGKRKSVHKRAAGGQLVHKAVVKHGWENCKFEYIATDLENELAWSLEQKLIHEWNLTDRACGYNIGLGGAAPTAGIKLSESHKQKISDSLLGHLGYWTGKTKSDASKEIMRKKMTGREITWKAKLSKVVLCHETNQVFSSTKEAAKALHLHDSSIARVCRGKLKQTGGFTFSYKDSL